MPTFSHDPPANPNAHSLPILRTPSGKPLVAVVTSSDLIGCQTHWWGGRTTPCEDPDCEPCRLGMPSRWHGYVSAMNLTNHTHFLFEFTGHAAAAFTDYRDIYKTLTGCAFEAKRASGNPNSRVLIRCKPADLNVITLPPGPDLERVLAILWSITPAQLPKPNAYMPDARVTPLADVIADLRQRQKHNGERDASRHN